MNVKNPNDNSEKQYHELSLEDAQDEFRELVKNEKNRALWFMRESVPVDIMGPQADIILENIARSGSRDVWLEAKRLKKWRLHHIK